MVWPVRESSPINLSEERLPDVDFDLNKLEESHNLIKQGELIENSHDETNRNLKYALLEHLEKTQEILEELYTYNLLQEHQIRDELDEIKKNLQDKTSNAATCKAGSALLSTIVGIGSLAFAAPIMGMKKEDVQKMGESISNLIGNLGQTYGAFIDHHFNMIQSDAQQQQRGLENLISKRQSFNQSQQQQLEQTLSGIRTINEAEKVFRN